MIAVAILDAGDAVELCHREFLSLQTCQVVASKLDQTRAHNGAPRDNSSVLSQIAAIHNWSLPLGYPIKLATFNQISLL